MANLNKYDPRVDSLVMETRTLWADEVGELSDEDKTWLEKAVHETPEHASTIIYERSHTGFTRTITVGVEDIERIYQDRL